MSLPPFADMQLPASTRNRHANEELDRRLGFAKDAGSGDDSEDARDDEQERTPVRMADLDTHQQRVISINVGGHLSREHAKDNQGFQTERAHHSNSLHQNRGEGAVAGQADARSVHFSPEIRMAIENQLDPSQNHK